MTNKEKQITKGEIGNVVGGYPVFELIVDKKLKRVVLLDDVQKFLDKALSSQRKDIVEKIKKGFIKTADNYILNSKIEPKLVLNKHQFWKMIKENLITKEDE